nr:MAG TPA: hypothetical protein [Caudoviricetes sp.]
MHFFRRDFGLFLHIGYKLFTITSNKIEYLFIRGVLAMALLFFYLEKITLLLE